MTPKEFLRQEHISNDTKIALTHEQWQEIYQWMEGYHETELKKLRVGDVVGRSEQLVCEECKEPMIEPYAERYGKKFCLGCM